MTDNDKKVGYCQPPKTSQFKKGKSGNPKGRPKKQPPSAVRLTDADILRHLDGEMLEHNGIKMTKRELELRILQAKALKGDLTAIKLLDAKRSALKLDQPQQKYGVLVVPQAPSLEEWKIRAYHNQARFREAGYSASSDLTPPDSKS